MSTEVCGQTGVKNHLHNVKSKDLLKQLACGKTVNDIFEEVFLFIIYSV